MAIDKRDTDNPRRGRMNTNLFGNNIEEKKTLTTMKRIVTRQTDIKGRDLYTTNPKDIERFLLTAKKDKLDILDPIWEPAAGLGHISKTLIHYGYHVYSSDLYAYIDEETEILESDFFAFNSLINRNCKTIFTNPPFNDQKAFLLHALSFGVDVIFFVRISFLTSKTRLKIYEKYKPTFIYIYAGRAGCFKNGDSSRNKNMVDYCVIVWKPPYNTETITRWIP
jgi:hypothetical protein